MEHLMILLVTVLIIFMLIRIIYTEKRFILVNKNLRETLTRLEEQTRAKDYLLSQVSYEIRASMSNIIGITDLFTTERLSAQKIQYIKDIRQSAEILLGNINDVIDLNKLREGRIQIIPTETDLCSLLRHTVSIMSLSARSKGLDFIEEISLNPNEYVRVDDVRLNYIILNLLSNAIKFTKSGYIKFSAKTVGGKLVFEVTDTGSGIKEDDIPALFSYADIMDKSGVNIISQGGLGLTVSKNFAELMGGEIIVKSEYGKGSVFNLTIPHEPCGKPQDEAEGQSGDYICAPEAKILLVDDMQINLIITAGLLRLCGITADVAVSGKEAVELVQTRDYDLIFMDHMMPEMNGIETTEAIRALGRQYENIPIIALTAYSSDETRKELLESGMNDFLLKPIDINLLMHIMQKWLPADKLQSQPLTAAPISPQGYSDTLIQAAKIPGLDIKLALSRLKGMQNLLEASLKQMSHSIDRLLKKMDESLSEGDLRNFAILAHGFKGSLANIGATYNSELATELEIAAKTGNMMLCAKKFTVFASVMESFAYDLKPLFPRTDKTSRPRGNSEFLALKIGDIIDCLNNFEAGDALSKVTELMAFTFGIEADKIIESVKRSIEGFNYNDAVSLLIKQLPAKAGRFDAV